jgi:hypothetical protein
MRPAEIKMPAFHGSRRSRVGLAFGTSHIFRVLARNDKAAQDAPSDDPGRTHRSWCVRASHEREGG